MRRSQPFLWFLVCVLTVGLCAPLWAHDLGLSGIRILYRKNDVVVNVTTALSKLALAEGRGKVALTPVEVDQAIRRRLHLRFDGVDLIPPQANVIGDNTNDIVSWQVVITHPVKDIEVLARLYPEDKEAKTVVSVVRDGQAVQDILLDAAHPDLRRSEAPPTPLAVALRYTDQGIRHILGGPDHILFVLGLLLLGGTLKSILRTVTAFTLAHSVTLSLAATGIVNPSPRIVEPLIALSIVAIAVENLRPHAVDASKKEVDRRPWYAFGFGLIHGFGFAGALAEVGLPQSALAVALATFNIGVELGQGGIVLSVFPVLTWLAKKHPVWSRRLLVAGSLLIAMMGSYWFVTRLLPA